MKKPLLRRKPKRILRLPDLDHSKTAVLNTLRSSDSQRAYRFAIDDFVAWYCSEPRLAFNKTVVLRYRLQLEGRHLASSTINLRLAAVRRLAHDAADSPELAAGIRRVKGAKKLGIRLGNWLTACQARALLAAPNLESIRGKRDRAILALLLGCGLRRSELVHLTVENVQQREDRWVIVDLVGEGGHIRTVPVPGMGKERNRPVDGRSEYPVREALPLCEQDRFCLGNRHHGEGCVDRSAGACEQCRTR